MKEVLDDIDRWRAAGKRVAVARVVGIEGSGPRDPGATMAVNEDGEVAGSVSGGCVEGAVVHRGARRPRRRPASAASSPSATPTTRPSPSASPAAARSTSSSSRSTGESTAPSSTRCATALRAERAGRAGHRRSRARTSGRKLLVRPGRRAGRLARRPRPRPGRRAATRSASSRPGSPSTRHYGAHGEARERDGVGVHRVVRAAAPHDHLRRGRLHRGAGPGGQGARLPGHRVRRPRGVRHPARFPMADEVVIDWPDRLPRARSATSSARATPSACSPTTTSSTCPPSWPRCATDVGYLGAMGIRRTHAERVARLREAGRRPTAGSGPGHGADRARHRRPHARGDRDLDLRRDHRAAHRAPGRSRCATPRARSTERAPIEGAPRGSRHRGPARRGRGRVEGTRLRRRARRSPPKGCRSRSAAAIAEHDRRPRRPRSAATRCRSSPTSRPSTARPASCATRATRSAVSTSSCANAGGPPPGNFAVHDPGGLSGRVRAQLPAVDRDVLTRPCRRCASSGGGGWSRSRRSRCASRSRGLILSNTAASGLTGFLKTLAP